MQHDRLISGIAIALAGCAAVLTILGLVSNPAILFVALALGAAAYFMWYQTSGRMARRLYRSVERQARRNGGRTRRDPRQETGGFGAGPREEWVPPGENGGRGGTRQQAQQQQQRRAPSTTNGLSRAKACRLLGVDPDADAETIKEAYREKVKQVHPDTDGGDEEQFKRVNRAYERLT